jgi:hypothetical protein
MLCPKDAETATILNFDLFIIVQSRACLIVLLALAEE